MKTYIVFCIRSFSCVVEGKAYNPKRAMVGVFNDDGEVCQIKLIKCSSDFAPQLEKAVHIFFDDNGKAVAYKLADK